MRFWRGDIVQRGLFRSCCCHGSTRDDLSNFGQHYRLQNKICRKGCSFPAPKTSDLVTLTLIFRGMRLVCIFAFTAITFLLSLQFSQLKACRAPTYALENTATKFQINTNTTMSSITHVLQARPSFVGLPNILPQKCISRTNILACRFPILMIQRL